MKKEIWIVGMGMGSQDLMTKEIRCALIDAKLIIGATRMKEILPGNCHGEFIETFDGREILKAVSQSECEKIVICMSGDSGFFSGTKKLYVLLKDKYDVTILPGISSISYLSAKTGISWQDACIMSIHGRKENWIQAVRTHEKTFLLLGGGPTEVVSRLCMAGLGNCQVILGCNLSYPEELVISNTASELNENAEKLRKLENSICVMYLLNKDAGNCYSTGIPDTSFIRNQVPMTKSEVRAVVMSRLHLKENAVVYDIGAGTGSITVEMAMQAVKGSVYSIECNSMAVTLLKQNCEKFMTDNVEIIIGTAPEALTELPAPDAAFIGGSRGNMKGILMALLKKNPGIRVTMDLISLESLTESLKLMDLLKFQNVEIIQIAVSRAITAGTHHLMEGLNPVYMIAADGYGYTG